MLILAATLLALLLVPVLGGRLSGLAELAVRRGWLVPAALGLQVLVITIVPHWPRPLLVALHAVSYLAAGVFVWTNRRVPGLPLLAGGGGLNALAIAVNGGQMPADPDALRAAGLPLEVGHFVNSGVVAEPRLAFLGDVMASPSWLPLQNVYSLGDLLILSGAVWVVHRSCGTVVARDPRPALRRLLGEQPPSTAVADLERQLAEAAADRDAALAEVARTGARNVALARELAALRAAARRPAATCGAASAAAATPAAVSPAAPALPRLPAQRRPTVAAVARAGGRRTARR